ncbi:hypothetical protein PC9H_002812 [Pleurotus ostreatus]|uniref:Uncharacterized protein n=1 Tax=Pleurotus ostreatus TaxID=5322 RepID=A0A8H7DN67_PLEOS|nr:uncharacterized protein PC9H_002812 [Pleurotus ostreatus]KAF7416025.1 hypothetical protein PC9H_002812 [Pleurotus ostreatus]
MRPNPMGGPMMGGPPQSMMGGGPGPSGMQGPPMGVNGPFGQGMAGGPMGNMIMSPGMSHPQAGGMRTPQMLSTEMAYRHNMQNIHKQPMAVALGTPQFNPGNRPGPGPGPQQQNKPMNSMAPPPSPGMKDQNTGGTEGWEQRVGEWGPRPGGPGGSPAEPSYGETDADCDGYCSANASAWSRL